MTKVDGRRMATPLLAVLVAIETADLVFAVDSVPAVLAITNDPFIVYTSNVFAILGLRSMFFALAGVMRLFSFLHYGLSAVLVFVGFKMMLSTVYKIPTIFSLAVISGILALSVAASMWHAKRHAKPRELRAGHSSDSTPDNPADNWGARL